MSENQKIILQRKKEHLELCATDKVAFKNKSTGFENYEFIHSAITEVDLNKIDLQTNFFDKIISFPFLISCMTGGTSEADNINLELAIAAKELNVPIGLGSLRYAIGKNDYDEIFKEIKSSSGNVPILANIGAAQVCNSESFFDLQKLRDKTFADIFVIHLNPLQELLQPNGEPHFPKLISQIEKFVKEISIPVIVKEVGSGISAKDARIILETGVKGIDTAGAGGTSWAGVEMLRNEKEMNDYFWDWGLPTSHCIKNIFKLKKRYQFLLIGSGGINNSIDVAKALALGADLTASARIILQELNKNNIDGVVKFVKNIFEDVKKIMFLTNSQNLDELRNKKLIKKKDLI
ncbi:MAG: type 2 isopentenyl-diphosphate Delta-isomerase [Chlorobiaceae bacterium]|nr:type 2 isopentenyl-diphosphate Delta-isomerase [Chlorobiaceae bacterium]MBA4308708.1 type 2 isopentenyl-diphosphate Delta-isomerase [Chlorobiaceae bacterium]